MSIFFCYNNIMKKLINIRENITIENTQALVNEMENTRVIYELDFNKNIMIVHGQANDVFTAKMVLQQCGFNVL